ncbi:hypothetical protein ACFQL1_14210 [Halomicroarcula sp. GCM10025709]|uniref:hypothetical protein n=1 Tax=Halomicroarcula sp. GCM10025709 TaxID=3252669 RepID=UPI003621A17F
MVAVEVALCEPQRQRRAGLDGDVPDDVEVQRYVVVAAQVRQCEPTALERDVLARLDGPVGVSRSVGTGCGAERPRGDQFRPPVRGR